MPLLRQPDTATQLAEARRRLEEHTNGAALPKPRLQSPDVSQTAVDRVTVIVYYLCDEPIPYSTRVQSATVTLRQFKDIIVKKGSFRYADKLDVRGWRLGACVQYVPIGGVNTALFRILYLVSCIGIELYISLYSFIIKVLSLWHVCQTLS